MYFVCSECLKHLCVIVCVCVCVCVCVRACVRVRVRVCVRQSRKGVSGDSGKGCGWALKYIKSVFPIYTLYP